MKKKLQKKLVLSTVLCMSLIAAPVSGSEFTDGETTAVFSDEKTYLPSDSGARSETIQNQELNNEENAFSSGEDQMPDAEVDLQSSAQAAPEPVARTIREDVIYEYVPETDTYKVTGTEFGFRESYSVNRTIAGKTVTEIGEKAFADLPYIKKIVISDNITTISKDAFENDTDLIIQSPDNSYACEYAKNAGFTWQDMTVNKIGALKIRTIYSANEIHMEWDPVEAADGYEVYLYNPDKGKYDLKETITKNVYTICSYSQLSRDCYYKVRAFSGSGIYQEEYGEFSDAIGKVKPEKPFLKAIEKKDNGLQISWNAAENAEGYDLYRAETEDGPWTEINKVMGGETTTYLDESVEKAHTYYYKVKAFRVVDNGFYYGKESSPLCINEEFAYDYVPETDSYKIITGLSDTEQITIPATYNGKRVTEIADKAFRNFDRVKSLRINNEGRIIIGKSAFEDCSQLRFVSVRSEAKIESRAFYNCPKLISYGTIGNIGNDTVIEKDSFDPDTKMIISGGEYGWDESVKNFVKEHKIFTEIPDTDGNYSQCRNGVTYMYSDYDNSDVCVDFDNSSKSVLVENGTGIIGKKAFYDCENVTKVLLPGSVKKIDSQAFAWCRNMTITIPKSVTSISKNAFENASNITIRTVKGSYAEKYAKKHGIRYNTSWNIQKVKTPNLSFYYDKNGIAFLKWSKIEYADKYKIYQYNKETGKYKWITTQDKNTFVYRTYLGKGSQQKFKIRAYSEAGIYENDHSPYSKTVTIQEKPESSRITTAVMTKKGVVLKWTASDGAVGYIIWRDGKKIATISRQNIKQYTDTNVKKDSRYYYSIQPFGKTKDGIRLYGDCSNERLSS